MALTGDSRIKRSSDATIGDRLSGWWSSTPNADGTPSTPGSRSRAQSNAQPNTPTKLRKSMTVGDDISTSYRPSALATSTSVSSSRFSFISSSMSAITRIAQQNAADRVTTDDGLCDLDIKAALMSVDGPAEDQEGPSAAAFKALRQTATDMLARFQDAYRKQALVIRDMRAERGAEVDEHEEITTRAEHLKLQLENMARKAAEQEEAIQTLLDELNAEKKARAEENLARATGLSRIADHPPPPESSVSEDLGVDEDQRRRRWTKQVEKSDGGFETDDESFEEGSVFSRSRSPILGANGFEGSVPDGSVSSQSVKSSNSPPATIRQQRPPQQVSAFQKLFKGISGDGAKENDAAQGPMGCRNCRGQDASVAWNTVSLLRDENKGLKQRVGQLESAVECALDIVHGVGR